MKSRSFEDEGKSTSGPRRHSYSDQCAQAIARAGPSADWVHKFNNPGEETLEYLTVNDIYMPVVCALGILNGRRWTRNLTKSIKQPGDSDLANIWAYTNKAWQMAPDTVYGTPRPIAVFLRASQPRGLNMVMHNCYRYRDTEHTDIITHL